MSPMRTCLGCRRKTNKSDLIRIVRSTDGRVHADPLAKAPGRGAYLCRDAECLKRVRKSGALARSLKVQIPEEVYEKLLGEMEAEHDG